MKKKRTYQATRVERVDVKALLSLLAAGCIVAIDVAKEKFVVALSTLAGNVVKLLRFDHPVQTRAFVEMVVGLRNGLAPERVIAAMEPTGTYGDAVRHLLSEAKVEIQMVSPKRTHDSQEIFDGVPSLHDPKSAAVIAKLCSLELARRWQPPSVAQRRLRALVEQRRYAAERIEVCCGRLEAQLARHWPEFARWLDLREHKTALRVLSEITCPERVASDPEGTRAFVNASSRKRIAQEAIDGLIADARATTGVPMLLEEEELTQMLAKEVLSASAHCDELEREMKKTMKDDESFQHLASWLGVYTAAVIVTRCDPRQYATAHQLEKACGLNLREKSSGEHHGRLSITKRGPGVVRQVLFLLALRMIQTDDVVNAWYVRRRGHTEESKKRAVVAVMRKLVRALFHVARGATFDAAKLFDVRRLNVEVRSKPTSVRRAPRTTPRATTRGRRSSAATLRASS